MHLKPHMTRSQVFIASCLSYTAIILLACREIWKPGVLGFRDLSPMYRYDHLLRALDFPWDGKSNLGSPNLVPGNMLYSSALFLFSLLLGSVELGHKVFFLFMFVLAGVGFYLCARTLLPEGSFPFISGLCYLFNHWIVFQASYGHNTVLLGYALLPFSLLLYFRSLNKPSFWSIAGCGVTSGLLFWASFHLSYLFFILMVLHGAVYLFCENRSRLLEAGRIWVAVFATTVISSVAIAAPLLSHILGVQIPSFIVRYEEVKHLQGTISLQPDLLLQTLFGIVAVFLALIRGKGRYPSQFLFILAATGGALALGGLWPFSLVYSTLFENIPFFYIFRETFRFLSLSTIAIAFSAGYVSGSASRRAQPSELIRIGASRLMKLQDFLTSRSFSCLFLLATILLSTSFVLPGDYSGALKNVEIPSHYKELDSWLSEQKGDFRVALFPPASWATVYAWSKDWFLDPMISLQAKPTIEIKSELDLTRSASIVRWIYNSIYKNMTQFWGRLLGVLGVRYVIIRGDADMPTFRKDLYSFNHSMTMKLLSTQKDLCLVKTIGPLKILENRRYLPHIFAVEEVSVAAADRRLLISLSDHGVDFIQTPISFVDDAPELISRSKRLFLDGDKILDLVLGLSSNYVIDPSRHAAYSSDWSTEWVRGDYVWFLLNGEFDVCPQTYVATYGPNSLRVPVITDVDGPHVLLVKIYRSTRREISGAKIKIDNSQEWLASSNSTTRGSFDWILLGELSLTKDRHDITIQGLGGLSALSRVAVVPSQVFQEKISETPQMLNQLNLTYVLEDYVWDKEKSAELAGSEFSCGSAALLNSTSKLRFSWYVPKTAHWVFLLKGRALTSEGSEIKLEVGTQTFIGTLRNGEQALRFSLDEALPTGSTVLTVHSAQAAVFDSLVISEASDKILNDGIKEANTSITYQIISESEYSLDARPRFLLFTEAQSDYWKLETSEGLVSSHLVFGYANLYDLSNFACKARLRLFYLGLDYVRNGISALAISLPSLWIVVAFLFRRRKFKREADIARATSQARC